jgi:serine/threonine protein kinase
LFPFIFNPTKRTVFFYPKISKITYFFNLSSYLHNCDPPIIHGDLSCDTIFIQHNGLIKIGSIAPDIVNTHVKTCIDFSKWSRHMHFLAPEISDPAAMLSAASSNEQQPENDATSNEAAGQQQSHGKPSTAIDMYAFGMVALEVRMF